MEINISKLQSEISNYNNKVKQYEECMRNLYNVLSQSSLYWKDGKTNAFFDNLHSEKQDITEIITNLNQISNVYSLILEKYEKFGEKLQYDLNYRNVINVSFDKLIFGLNNLIKRYNELDLSFNPSERHLIFTEKNKIVSIKNNIEDLKEKVSKVYDEFEEIEREVNHKISEINIKVLKESNVEDYI